MASEDAPRTVWQNLRVLVPIAMLQTAVYVTLNHWQWRPIRSLPISAVDEWFPFWPWTVLPYLLFFLSSLPVALTIRNRRVFRRAVIAYFFCLMMTVPIFVFWPTACPRPDLSSLDSTWGAEVYRVLTRLDTPACSFPSMHIMLPAIVCWAVWAERRVWAGSYASGMLLLSLTILTTKQHYAWDWLGGLIVAAIGLWAAGRFEGED